LLAQQLLVLVKAAVDGMSPEEKKAWDSKHPKLAKFLDFMGATGAAMNAPKRNEAQLSPEEYEERFEGVEEVRRDTTLQGDTPEDKETHDWYKQQYQEGEEDVATPEQMAAAEAELAKSMNEADNAELEETKAALEAVRSELNEVNLLNSKLLYVNRIFKANNLNEAQKLRVVETLDNASNVKEAKLIYETIKDTFNVAKSTKTTPKRSIKEGLGMASKAAGTSTAPKKPVLNESNDMVTRMQKLANIKINQ
jgi:hypothetical protein